MAGAHRLPRRSRARAAALAMPHMGGGVAASKLALVELLIAVTDVGFTYWWDAVDVVSVATVTTSLVRSTRESSRHPCAVSCVEVQGPRRACRGPQGFELTKTGRLKVC